MRRTRKQTTFAISCIAGLLALVASAVAALVFVAAVTAGAPGTSRERVQLVGAAAPASSPAPSPLPAASTTPGTLLLPHWTSPAASPPTRTGTASPEPSPTWTGKPGAEVYYGTLSKDDCVKRGEEGVASGKWTSYRCKKYPPLDASPTPGQVIENLLAAEEPPPGQARRDHALWVVDWWCRIKMENDCS